MRVAPLREGGMLVSFFTSPRKSAGLSGESSCIAELDLVRGACWFALAWVDGRRLVDFGDRSAREQELADEFCEAERRHLCAIGARCDAQQQIGDHRGEDLQTDRVVVGAEELADIEMLL